MVRDAARRKAELEARILSRQEAMASKIIKDMDYERKETENMAADKVRGQLSFARESPLVSFTNRLTPLDLCLCNMPTVVIRSFELQVVCVHAAYMCIV
jgi:hypothetical protein